jgi:hypothetical protein
LRRRVLRVEGRLIYRDGHVTAIDAASLLSPLERALKMTAFGLVALALALTVFRLTDH